MIELYQLLVDGGPALQAMAIAYLAWEIRCLRGELTSDIHDLRGRVQRLETNREVPAQ